MKSGILLVDETGEIIETWETTIECAHSIGISVQALNYRMNKGVCTEDGIYVRRPYWQHMTVWLRKEYVRQCVGRKKQIIQKAIRSIDRCACKLVIIVDIEGNITHRFVSATEAAKSFGISNFLAANHARNQEYDRQGHLWLYACDAKGMQKRHLKALFFKKISEKTGRQTP